jgi:hypothetical protein
LLSRCVGAGPSGPPPTAALLNKQAKKLMTDS